MTALVAPGARLVDAVTGRELGGRQLGSAVRAVAVTVAGLPEGLLLCLSRNDIGSVLRYLGARAAGRPVLLYDGDAPAADVIDLVRRFEPAAVLGLTPPYVQAPAGYRFAEPTGCGRGWLRHAAASVAPDAGLSLLLATSGSTGRPRLVRQSSGSVLASAGGIVKALGIDETEVAVTSLPLHYTLGLSVL